MNPETFLLPEEISELVNVLKDFIERFGQNVLEKALKLNDMDISELRFSDSSVEYAQEVVLAWKEAKVSDKRPGGYHPLVSVIGHLLKIFQWNNEKQKHFLDTLLKRGEDNLKALEVCKVVGRIESPLGTGIGTAVLVGKDQILTCHHIFKDYPETWVRFGHNPNQEGKKNERCFSLSKITGSQQKLDFAVATLDKQFEGEFVQFNSQKPSVDEHVRIIHYSGGGPLKISPAGTILKIPDGQLHHTINDVEGGASGAPIFNASWQVIALHSGTSRGSGTFCGITLDAIQNEIAVPSSSRENFQDKAQLHVNSASTIEQAPFVEQIENWLREQEVSLTPDKTKQTSAAIELKFLNYGLDIEITKFQTALIPAKGAFAFEMHGDNELIQKYIMVKILRALQHKIGDRTYSKKEISLYAEDIWNSGKEDPAFGLEVIERRIQVEKQVSGIDEFLADIPKSQDIVFIIWYKSLLSPQMKLIARSFWNTGQAKGWQKMDRGRRFVVIWITLGAKKRESIGKPFTSISLPEKFDLDDLSNWFWGQLQNHIDKEEIEEKVVKDYITSIKGHYGYLKETYSRLEEIAQELANGNVGKG